MTEEPRPTWQKSDEIAELATALAKAQAAMKPAAKDSENPHFRSRYADLASIWEACRDALTANELAVMQLPDLHAEEVGVTTLLVHKSGQWLSGRIAMVMPRRDPQAVGSAITYGRRYGLAAMVGIVSEEDDDAEKTRGDGDGTKAKVPKPKPEPKPKADTKPAVDPMTGQPTISEEQAADLETLLKDASKTEAWLMKKLGYGYRLEHVRIGDYARVVEGIARAMEAKK